MCKHVAAVLYGVGARLDAAPELLFTLRGVDRHELVATVGPDLPFTRSDDRGERVLADDDVAALFGIDIAAPDAPPRRSKASRKGGWRVLEARRARRPIKRSRAPGGPRPEPRGQGADRRCGAGRGREVDDRRQTKTAKSAMRPTRGVKPRAHAPRL